jgi:hypothetical protein
MQINHGAGRELIRMRCLDRMPIAAVLGIALLASGCSGASSLLGGPTAPTPTASAVPPAAAAPAPPPSGTPAPPPSGTSALSSSGSPAPSPSGAPAPAPRSAGTRWLPASISDFFSGSSDKGPQPVAGATADVECPYIDIREGASTLTVRTGADNPAMSLKYQGSIVRAARQCALVNGQMVMKVGVEGRIILGPQGTPGQITVPLRIAIVNQPPGQSTTILTKLILIPVTVSSLDDNPSFTHVEDGLAFPMPAPGKLDDYIVYIGFDPIAAQAQQRHERPRRRVKRKPKPAPTG